MVDVLWYLHDRGLGHRSRFERIASRLTVSVLSVGSGEAPAGGGRHIHLASDAGATAEAWTERYLHYAPIHHDGLLRRHSTLARIIAEERPMLAVIDVSVEVGVFVRLMGIPLIVVRQPGERQDPPHRLIHSLADEILAPWPAAWDRRVDLRTTHLGLPTPRQRPATRIDSDDVLVVVGRGGTSIDRFVIELIADEMPDRRIRVAGIDAPGHDNIEYLGRSDDVPGLMEASGVVIGNAGLGTLSEVAWARRPFVCVPEERPFGEQWWSAEAMRVGDEAVIVTDPVVADWRASILAAERLGADRLAAHANPEGWQLAADLIERSVLGTTTVSPA